MTVPAVARANPTIAAKRIRGSLKVTKMVISVGLIRFDPPRKVLSMIFKNRLEGSLTGPIPELTIETESNRMARIIDQVVMRRA